MIILGFFAIIVFLGGAVVLNAVGPWFAKRIDRMPGPGCLAPAEKRVLQRQLAEGQTKVAFGPGPGIANLLKEKEKDL